MDSLALGSVHIKIIQSFGHEHHVVIRYHDSGMPDNEIAQRACGNFANTFCFFPGSTELQRKQDLSGKVAVYCSRYADKEARKSLLANSRAWSNASTKCPWYLAESGVAQFLRGSALIAAMATHRSAGNEDEAVDTWIES